MSKFGNRWTGKKRKKWLDPLDFLLVILQDTGSLSRKPETFGLSSHEIVVRFEVFTIAQKVHAILFFIVVMKIFINANNLLSVLFKVQAFAG